MIKKIDETFYLNNLPKLSRLLDKPFDKKSSDLKIIDHINHFASKIRIRFLRITNYIFGDHHWYNEKIARKVIKYYIAHKSDYPEEKLRKIKILEIFDTLCLLPRGSSNYGSRIDKENILGKETSSTPTLKKNNNPLIIEKSASSSPISYKPKIEDEPISLELLFHIHANQFGSNSSLEGLESSSIPNYFSNYLNLRKNEAPFTSSSWKTIIEKFANACDLTISSFSVICNKIESAFKNQTTLLIVGGWKAVPSGHAIYYEILPEGTSAKFRLYNLGAGADRHEQFTLGYKKKYMPYKEWEGISKERFLDKHFLKAMHELCTQVVTAEGKSTAFDENDIYTAFEKILKPTRTNTLLTEKFPIAMSPHEPGICSLKSRLAFIRTYLALEDYKRFICDIKLHSLIHYVQKNLDHRVTIIEWRLVNKSLKSLSRSIPDLYHKKIIDQDYLIQAKENLKEIALWTEKYKTVLYRKIANAELKYIAPAESMNLDLKPVGLIIQVSENQAVKSSNSYQFTVMKLKQIDLSSPLMIEKKIQEVLEICKIAWLNGEDQALNTGIIQCISLLPLNSTFWNDAASSLEITQQLIIDLAELSDYFFKSCFMVLNPHKNFPQRYYVFSKIQFIQYTLAKNVSPEWNRLIPSTPLLNVNRGFFLHEGRIQKEIKEIAKALYKARKETKDAFQGAFGEAHLNDDFNTNNYGLGKSTCLNNFTSLIPILEKIIPDLYQKMSTEDISFSRASPKLQNAKIFLSNQLPNWIQAIRKTNLLNLYMVRETIAKPPMINREKDLSLTFDIETFRNNTNVFLSIEGITSGLLKENPELLSLRKGEIKLSSFSKRCPSPDMKPFFDWIEDFYGLRRAEKDYILASRQKPSNLKMSKEEFKELISLFCFQKIKIVNAITYFSFHLKKLEDPDYQIIFQKLLFEHNLLHEEAKTIRAVDQLRFLMKKNLDRFEAENKIQPCVFIIQMMRYIESFQIAMHLNATERLTFLSRLLSIEIKPKERSVVYAELIAHLCKKETLNPEDVENLLSGLAYISENPIPVKWSDPQTNLALIEAVHLHARKIADVLNLSSDIPNQILKRIHATPTHLTWVIRDKDAFPAFYSNNNEYAFFPLDGVFLTKNLEVSLPVTIKEHPDFKRLFPTISKGVYLSHHFFQFFNQSGLKTLVQLDNFKLVIDQCSLTGEWSRLIPLNDLNSFQFFSRWLCTERFVHWQSLAEPSKILIFNSKTSEPVYRVILKGKDVSQIICLSNDTFLSSPWPSFTDFFEDGSYVHKWFGKDQKIKKIEFPRYRISFSTNQQDNLEWDQMPGFYLDQTTKLYKLGSYDRYLILKNLAGKQKVLIPYQSFLMRKDLNDEVLLPKFLMNEQLENDQIEQKYLVYDLDSNGFLLSKSIESNLYLAQVLTVVQEYNKSAFYLKKYGEKLSAFSKDERQILEDFVKLNTTGDTDANAHALKVFAFYLLLKNQTHDSDNETTSNKIVRCLGFSAYLSYLKKYQNVTCGQLKSVEELFLIRYFLKSAFSAEVYLRLKELAPLEAQDYTLPVPVEKRSSVTQTDKIEYASPPAYWDQKETLNWNTILITRFAEGYNLEKYFLQWFDIAKNGSTNDKTKLRHALIFKKNRASETDLKQINLLECVLDFPKHFTNPPLKKEWNGLYGTWLEEIVLKATQLRNHSSKSVDLSNVRNLTPSDFHLDPPLPKINEFKVNLLLNNTSRAFALDFQSFFNKVKPNFITHNKTTLGDFLNQLKADDLIKEQEITRIKNDNIVYRNKPQRPVYTLEVPIDVVKKELSKKSERAEKLKQLEIEILTLANPVPSSSIDQARDQLLRWGGLNKPLVLEELLINFARQKPLLLQQRPNYLLEEGLINQIYSKLGEYLLIATTEQQRLRALATLEKIESLGPNKDQVNHELNQQIASDLLTERSYIIREDPAYLVFEYFANLILNKEQVDKLKIFLKEGSFHLVMEMIMGSGKSKILLPLLALLRAKPGVLSMIIVPEFLFESISSDTQSALKSFSQSLKTIHFDRNSTCTTHFLKQIRADLLSIEKNEDCLIMTNKSVACLLLKYVEMCNDHLLGKELKAFPEEVTILREILTILSKSGYPLLEEADSILNALREFSFSLGKAGNPSEHEIQIISELYRLLYLDPEIKNLAQVETNSTFLNPSSPRLNQKLYTENLKPALAKAIIIKMETMQFSNTDLTAQVNTFAKDLKENEKNNLIDYLCRSNKKQDFFDSLQDKPELQDIIALAGEEISRLLSFTLLRNFNENYGLSKNDKKAEFFALPYLAANTPSYGSEFANHHITMNYTFQSYMKEGISPSILSHLITQLQSEALSELRDDENLSLINTKAWIKFCSLKRTCTIPFFDIKPSHLKKLSRHLNESDEAKLTVVSQFILPQLNIFQEKLSFNPQNLVALFPNQLIGFTGTLWNALSFSHKIEAAHEVGTDAKTLNLLWNNSQNAVISIENASTPSDILAKFKEQNISFDLISDAGGYFKQKTNVENATLMALLYGKSVVFYDENGVQKITDGELVKLFSESTLKEEERLTFLDQINTIGADIKHGITAVELVTIRKNMPLPELLQAVWRLRGLDKSQKAIFVISKEVEESIRQVTQVGTKELISFQHILQFVITNQSKRQGEDNYRALIQQLDNIPQTILVSILLKSDQLGMNDIKLAFDMLRNEWIKPIGQSARHLYGTFSSEQPTAQIVEEKKKHYTSFIKSIFSQLPFLNRIGMTEKDSLDELDIIIKRLKDKLPLKIFEKKAQADQTVQVQRQIQVTAQTYIATESDQQNPSMNRRLGSTQHSEIVNFSNLTEAIFEIPPYGNTTESIWNHAEGHGPLPCFPFKLYLAENPDLKEYADAFDGIHTSVNTFVWPSKYPRVSDLEFFGPLRTHLLFCLIEKDRVLLLNSEDAVHFKQNPDFYNLNLGYYNSSKKPPPEAVENIIKIKFLNGTSHYTKEEQNFLKNWLTKHDNNKMHQFFIKKVLKGQPSKQESYHGSVLEKLFQSNPL